MYTYIFNLGPHLHYTFSANWKCFEISWRIYTNVNQDRSPFQETKFNPAEFGGFHPDLFEEKQITVKQSETISCKVKWNRLMPDEYVSTHAPRGLHEISGAT